MRSATITTALTSAILSSACLALDAEPGGEPFDLDCSIPTSAIFNGGPGRDGIASLSNPEALTPTRAGISDGQRVLGILVNGEARAYPLTILWLHEIINDQLGGESVLVSYCPLTGSGIAFDRSIRGETRSFGVSGLLYENNLIMFDRQTESLWNQLLLGAQCGAERGTNLQLIPIVETTLGHWRELHPQTTVVTENTGSGFSYGFYPYGGYAQETNGETLFPGSTYSDERPPKELVLGLSHAGEDAAYPFGALALLGDLAAINDNVGGRDVVVLWEGQSRTAIAFDRELDGQTLTFSATARQVIVDEETSSEWNLSGVAVSGPLTGNRLKQIENGYTLFWFAWSVYHPSSKVF
ncbi:MAG: DUF3179 domain-containing protein, partial [Gemmatimonadota bacterium]